MSVSEPRPLGAEAREHPAGGSVGLASLIQAIDEILPQTQCRRCGFDGCKPYAEALAQGRSEINRCPPGGNDGVLRLASLLGRPVQPIDPDCGRADTARLIARIVEADCIGCTMCIQACPVDAIIGAPKRMHTVITGHCTGCELCVPPCPVDCIVLEPVPAGTPWRIDEAAAARQRHQARAARLARRELERAQTRIDEGQQQLDQLGLPGPAPAPATPNPGDAAAPAGGADARKREIIEAAIRRARERIAASMATQQTERP